MMVKVIRLVCFLAPALVVFVSVCAAEGSAYLSLHEARALVEQTPAFLGAKQKGYCPQTGDAIINGSVATVVVRGECRYLGVIGGFEVDLSTGTVTAGGRAPRPIVVETHELEQARKSLFSMRSDAQLTASDGVCLLNKVAVTPPARGSCRRTRIIRESESAFVGATGNACGGLQTREEEQYSVERYTGIVTETATGKTYSSPELDAIQKSLMIAHSPVRLTTDDAKRLVEDPFVAPELRGEKCVSSEVESDSNADEVWLQVKRGCDGRAVVTRKAVNVVTGSVRMICPDTLLDSPELRQLVTKLFDAARLRRAEATETIKRQCENSARRVR